MQILSSNNSVRMPPAQSTAPILKSKEIFCKSDLMGDPAADLARGFSPNLLLTNSDRELIEKVTGVSVDPDTGVCTPPTKDADFINSIVDKRFMDYVNLKPAQSMTESDVRKLFEQAVTAGRPLDPRLMQKTLEWTSDVANAKTDKTDRSQQAVDVYA